MAAAALRELPNPALFVWLLRVREAAWFALFATDHGMPIASFLAQVTGQLVGPDGQLLDGAAAAAAAAAAGLTGAEGVVAGAPAPGPGEEPAAKRPRTDGEDEKNAAEKVGAAG